MTQEIQDFSAAVEKSLSDNRFVKVSLGHYKGREELKNIYIKKAMIKKEEKLSFTYHYKTKDITKNYALAEGAKNIQDALHAGFHAATLFTTEFDLFLEQAPGKKCRLYKKPPSKTDTAPLEHNRSKKRMLGTTAKPYLHALNITDADGHVLPKAQDKYRQIDKYVEILSGLIKNIPAERLQRIVDMGSGKGYLTFALYDYLSNVLKQKAQVTGVEYRADLVKLCNQIAKDAAFDGLRFVQGTIEEYDSTGTNILIALHACDTATDDAICKGIQAQAELIVVAPCCHKQIRREMEKSKTENSLDFLTRHGIFLEREAEMVTDGLRALILEYFSYTVKVFEFISDAHTPKNVLIVGTRHKKTPAQNQAVLSKIKEAKDFFGITQHHLEKLMKI